MLIFISLVKAFRKIQRNLDYYKNEVDKRQHTFNTIKDMNFPGGPVVENPRFHCMGLRLDPWSGN